MGTEPNPETIGLLAGAGRFPILFAQEARRQGYRVVAVGLAGVTDPALGKVADQLHVFKLGQVTAPLKAFKEGGVKRAVMIGKVQHVSLFGGVLPDLRAMKILGSLKDRRTDTILKAVAEEFAKEGIELLSSTTFLSHLIPAAGVLSRRKPTRDEAADIEFGWKAAKTIAGFDIGQTVIVKGRAVIAVEAMEGTDAAVLRAGELARSQGKEPGIVVVKVAKPQQDFRFDLPVLGLDTLTSLRQAGATALAFEAGKTVLFDRERFLEKADALKLAVISKEDSDG